MSESDFESPRHLPIGCKNDPLEKEPMMGQRASERRSDPDTMTFDPILMNKRLNDSNIAVDNFDLGLVPSNEPSTGGPIWLVVISKTITLTLLMYTFVCSLELLSTSFRLLGGKTANRVITQSELLQNPIVGLMIGVLVTVLVQSSSTSTSIVVTMVSSGLLTVQSAIPIVMGANIGTSVTNTIVSLMQASDRKEFGLAFAAATVHDMFNWLTVIVLLPVEVTFGYLEHATEWIVDHLKFSSDVTGSSSKGLEDSLLKKLTKPLTSSIVSINSRSFENIGNDTSEMPTLKPCCSKTTESSFNKTDCLISCTPIFNLIGLSDGMSGLILLTLSLVSLCTCLVLVVRLLHSMLKGRIALIIKTYINAEYKWPWSLLIGYVAIAIGCCLTILVQSSSVFTSALTPLAGIGVISLERVYPLTLGSNIGTTTTGLLAAATADPRTLHNSMQLALCHLLFNVTGIFLFYPIPYMRFPVKLARTLGRTTARYRWFAIFYLFFMFLLLPLFVFLLSLLARPLFALVFVVFVVFSLAIIAINCAQRHRPSLLPNHLRTWDFLPIWLHSLDPYDALLLQMADRCFLCACCVQPDAARDLPVIRAVSDTRHPSRLRILDAAGADSCSDVHLVTAYDNVMFVNWSASANPNDMKSETDTKASTMLSTNHREVSNLQTPSIVEPADVRDGNEGELVKFYVDSTTTSPK